MELAHPQASQSSPKLLDQGSPGLNASFYNGLSSGITSLKLSLKLLKPPSQRLRGEQAPKVRPCLLAQPKVRPLVSVVAQQCYV